MLENICLSGGAEGADLAWGSAATEANHSVVHFTFKSHRTNAPKEQICLLDDGFLRAADPACHKANETLKRHFPPRSPFAANLLRRNWYQIKDSTACYAISTIKNGVVQGGTSWATAMFIDKYDQATCPCYVFCQEAVHWFEWTGEWTPIYEPPIPTGVYTGIGSRNLTMVGSLAINILMNHKNIRRFDPCDYGHTK